MTQALQILIGVIACGVFIALARRMDHKKELRLYAAALVIAAMIYVGFAVRDPSLAGLALELVGLAVFTLVALLGLKVSAWILALGWAAHGAWDVILHKPSQLDFVPDWYPMVCLGVDLLLAGYIAMRVKRNAFE